MTAGLEDLREKSILVLGLGVEGQDVIDYLLQRFPGNTLAVAEARRLDELEEDQRRFLGERKALRVHLGVKDLSMVRDYDVVVRSPGIPVRRVRQAMTDGPLPLLTSLTGLFFAACKHPIIGVTGTKGKSTTASLIHAMLKANGRRVHLTGNIGSPYREGSPLPALDDPGEDAVFVYELSSFQLEDLTTSPHISVLLGVAPEHLDHHETYAQYLAAKENITRFQGGSDYLVYAADCDVAEEMARRTKARCFGVSRRRAIRPGCFISRGRIVFSCDDREEEIAGVQEVEGKLLGDFNLDNVLAATAASRIAGASRAGLLRGLQGYAALKDRFEFVGECRGILFYNAALSTIPETTMAHLRALRPLVDTLMLGGYDRGLDYTSLARCILSEGIRAVILFPESGRRIWDTVLAVVQGEGQPQDALPRHYFVESMASAVKIAYQVTRKGRICLHSPAAPSRGGTLFRDYADRGDQFKRHVLEVGPPSESSSRGSPRDPASS